MQLESIPTRPTQNLSPAPAPKAPRFRLTNEELALLSRAAHLLGKKFRGDEPQPHLSLVPAPRTTR